MIRALMLAAKDRKIWSLAGARGLNLLTAPGLGTWGGYNEFSLCGRPFLSQARI
jgi:hypothetical protein